MDAAGPRDGFWWGPRGRRRGLASDDDDCRAGPDIRRSGAARYACAPAVAADVAARCSGDRYPQAGLLRRARLVRHPDLRAAGLVAVGALAGVIASRPARTVCAHFQGHPARLPDALAIAAGAVVRGAHSALACPSETGAALESPRDAQLGGRDDAGLGHVHDDLAALPRFAAKLSCS